MVKSSAVFILFIFIVVLIGCVRTPSNNELINEQFDRYSPGYSSIKILDKKGDNPKILAIQATMNSLPNDITFEGELYFLLSDPSFLEMRWYTLEAVGHALLVQWASQMLKHPSYTPSPESPVALLIKRWIDEGLIMLDDVKNREVHDEVKSWIDSPGSQPEYQYKNAGLFDTSQIKISDLAPDLMDDQKSSIYVLLSNGNVDLYMVDKTKRYDYSPGKGLPDGIILPNPIPRPVESTN